MVAIFWIFRNRPAGKINKWFKRLQIVSASAMALSTAAGGWRIIRAMGVRII